jgi:release factor glutamine methyltransferase
MQTLLETLRKAEDFLGRKGLAKPKAEVEHLFAGVLGLKRLDLYLQFERLLNEAEVARLRDATVRRAGREPLQHILGAVEFRDLTLKSDKRALIPRPETEELVDLALALFPAEQAVRVLDLGTGSGAIALALAQERPAWKVDALDASDEALALARENAELTGLADRVNFAKSDWFGTVTDRYDLIVSNPPYLTDAEVASAEPEVRLFDPASALAAPEDGLADLRRILESTPKFLNPGGWVVLETGTNQHTRLAEISAAAGLVEGQGGADLSGRPRFWKARLKGG